MERLIVHVENRILLALKLSNVLRINPMENVYI